MKPEEKKVEELIQDLVLIDKELKYSSMATSVNAAEIYDLYLKREMLDELKYLSKSIQHLKDIIRARL